MLLRLLLFRIVQLTTSSGIDLHCYVTLLILCTSDELLSQFLSFSPSPNSGFDTHGECTSTIMILLTTTLVVQVQQLIQCVCVCVCVRTISFELKTFDLDICLLVHIDTRFSS